MAGPRQQGTPAFPWLLSLLIHGGFGILVLMLPANASRKPHLRAIELSAKKPPLPPPPPRKEEPKPEPPRPVDPTRVAMQRTPQRPVEPPPEPPTTPTPAPKDQPVVPPSFGLKLSGTSTAPAGQGVQVPEGDTLRASPTQKRPKDKKDRRPVGRPGFRKEYGKGEQAPLAVATTLPRMMKKVIPPYPEKAKELGIEGRVVLELTVNGEGKVVNVRVVTSLHPLLDAAAVEAARKMQFAPGTVNGTPVTLKIPVPFTFVLD